MIPRHSLTMRSPPTPAQVKHGLEGNTQYILLTPLPINLPRELSSRIHIVRLKKT